MSKVIRCWRVRPGIPHGVHVWFDPSVEHIDLLEGPVSDFPSGFDVESTKVAVAGQFVLPWKGDSVSGRGKREALREDARQNRRIPEGDPEIPF